MVGPGGASGIGGAVGNKFVAERARVVITDMQGVEEVDAVDLACHADTQ